MVRIWSSVNSVPAFLYRDVSGLFEGKTGRLEWEAEIGRRFKLINDMLDQQSARQVGLRFPRKADEMHWSLYGSSGSNHGLDTVVHADIILPVPDKFIMHSTV